MAQAALLEREYRASVEDEQNTPEAIAHRKRGEAIFSDFIQSKDYDPGKLAATFSMPTASAATASAAAATVERETAPAREETPAQRDLFANYVYRDHALPATEVREEVSAATYAPEAPAPAYTPAYTPAPAAPEVAPEIETEDTRPTQRTMDVLHREEIYERDFAIEQQPKERVGFFASLSAKAKMALAIVSATFVAAIAVVCINTGIINSMKSDVDRKQKELEDLSEYSETLNGRIEAVTDPAYVDDYAENVLGMTRS